MEQDASGKLPLGEHDDATIERSEGNSTGTSSTGSGTEYDSDDSSLLPMGNSVDGEDDPFADQVLDNIGRGGTRYADLSDDESDEGPYARILLGKEFACDTAMEVRDRLSGGDIVGWELGEENRPFVFQILVAKWMLKPVKQKKANHSDAPEPSHPRESKEVDDDHEGDSDSSSEVGEVKLMKRPTSADLKDEKHTAIHFFSNHLKPLITRLNVDQLSPEDLMFKVTLPPREEYKTNSLKIISCVVTGFDARFNNSCGRISLTAALPTNEGKTSDLVFIAGDVKATMSSGFYTKPSHGGEAEPEVEGHTAQNQQTIWD
eukprot:INCI16638.1.p1 GENE.INCI16638.1~~INCI16638.1.p1  ORF type:complete len:318 (-),score=49.12 INCI16638.1:130-1083(-)